MCNCSDWILLEHIYGTYACKLCFVQYACLYSIRMHARLCMCVHCSHRQTHGSLRSGEYYREVDHRGTRLVAKRQAPLINPLHTDAFPLCLSVSLTLSITVFSLFSTVPFCFVSIPYFVWLCLHSWEKGVFTCEIFKNHKSIIWTTCNPLGFWARVHGLIQEGTRKKWAHYTPLVSQLETLHNSNNKAVCLKYLTFRPIWTLFTVLLILLFVHRCLTCYMYHNQSLYVLFLHALTTGYTGESAGDISLDAQAPSHKQ